MDDDWEDDCAPPKPVAKPSNAGKRNDDDWDDEPQPSTSSFRAPSNGCSSNRPAPKKPTNNDDDWDDGPAAPSTSGYRGSTNGYNSNSDPRKKPMAKSNDDDDWDDDPPPPANNQRGGNNNNRNNNSAWGNQSSNSNSKNGCSGGKANNDDDWDDQPSGNTQTNGKRNNPFTSSDDWNDEAPKTKSARCDTNGGGSSYNNDGGSTSYSRPPYRSDRGPRKPDWICDGCQVRCFGSRDTCYKCHAEKGESKDAPDDGGSGNRGPRKSDWICDACGAKVFGSKSNCFKCQADKGDSKDAPDDGSGGNRGQRKSDWICDACGVKVFGSKSTCFKCHADKGESKDAPDDGSNGNRGQRKSDWICDACGVKVFGSKSNCFKCQADKGNSKDAPADDNRNGSGRQDNGNWADDDKSNNGARGKKPGDWECSCGHNNFASRDKCQKCDETKPEGAGAANGEHIGKVFYIPEEVKDDDLFSTGISTGINFEGYNKIPIDVVDTARNNIPKPIESFASSGLNELLLRNVERSGYKKPTPIQKHAIPIILGKRDLMACAQTGSGKTAAFLLPIIQTLLAENIAASIGSPSVVIISPTRELTTQIFNEARKYSQGSAIKVCQIYGGTASRHQSTILNDGCHILVATMGRLLDFCNRTYVEFNKLRFLVFDEADRMLDMGFQQDIQKIMNHPTMIKNKERQTIMFSATFPDDMCHLAGQYLNEQVFLKIGMVGGACADVEQTIVKIGKFEKRSKLLEMLQSQDGSTLVFVEQKKTADFLASFLSENLIKSTSIHGNRLQQQREQALGDFKSGRMKVLLATAVAARGLDIPNVKLVINFDLPKTIDEYVHRIGRTGRVGNVGKSTAFFDPERTEDQNIARDLKKVLVNANQTVPDFLESGGVGADEDHGGAANSADPPAHGGGGDDEEW